LVVEPSVLLERVWAFLRRQLDNHPELRQIADVEDEVPLMSAVLTAAVENVEEGTLGEPRVRIGLLFLLEFVLTALWTRGAVD
jgi:hypothetical protein